MDKQAVEKVWDSLTALGDSLAGIRGTGEARKHFAASRREALLGFSVLLEHAAEWCGPAGAGGGTGGGTGTEAKQAPPASGGRSIEIT
ncbi:MAG: hypothetical protein K0Q90_2544 [Paenibacillaceae bacterium]|jgi:hypothetical protein|nr:hypothetical protein [Paenibacillaceae bacterium]